MNRKNPTVLLGVILALLAGFAEAQPAPAPALAKPEETVTLSPFEVVADSRGYYGANAMSGTRLNSKLEDLASSISVVTKEQMSDFALLDVNDIFNYEASTEGTGNFTDFSFNASGFAVDNSQLDPNSANRIRGLGNALITVGNFETSGRTPIDPINIDSVEIGRGPNSNIFGIGSASGAVNTVPAAANLSKTRTTISGRIDDREGWRTSIDLNRVLKPGVLAVRGSVVHQHDGFTRKPSGVDTRRYNAMVKYRPFRNTTLSGSYSYYKAWGNRPNNTTPRDAITPWLDAGAHTWDPVTSTAKINGTAVGTFTGTLPSYFTAGGTNELWARIDQQGLGLLSSTVTTSSTNPTTSSGGRRLVASTGDPSGFLVSQPLIADSYPVSSKARYDWSEINFAAANRFLDRNEMFNVSLDQVFLETSRHTLAVQLGWFREANSRYSRNLLGMGSGIVGEISYLQIDPNERLLDGTPNPYFLRPFIDINSQYYALAPTDRDTYRAQFAYRLDLRKEKNLLRFLGQHQATAYAEYKDVRSETRNFRDAILSNHTWLTDSQLRGSTIAVGPLPTAGGIARPIQHYYLGDNQGSNIDYGSTPVQFGAYPFRYGNQTTGFVDETIQYGSASGEAVGGGNKTQSILRSRGAVVQSHWLRDRVVTTFGRRFDKRSSRSGAPPVFRDAISIDEDVYNTWANADWAVGEGATTSSGIVVKPLRWLSLHATRSNSFNPAAISISLRQEPLPDPSGRTEDYGFGLKLFGDKLIARVTRYKTISVNSRNGTGTTIAQRTSRLDFSWATSNGFALQRQATAWITAANPGLSTEQINERVAQVMQVPVSYLSNPVTTIRAVDDLVSRGTELELYFNPTPHWTAKLAATKNEAIASGVSADVRSWIEERLKVWTTVIDPRTNTLYWTTPYTPGGSPQAFFRTMVDTPLTLEQALQGKSRPQIRKYNANLTTSYRLAGLTEHWLLKRFTVGGAVRYLDKGAIGFHGLEQLPAVIEHLDASRPIYDPARSNFDAFAAYRTRWFANRVGATFQFNVRSLQENGRLQAIMAGPDGKPTAYRIVDSRQFILTATFDL
jgi:outer membrane receptor protein involved in Fe transport